MEPTLSPALEFWSRLRTLVALVFLVVFGLAAHAAATSAVPVGPDSNADSVLSLDPFMVTLIFGTLIPIIGGIVLKNSTSSQIKVLVNLVLSSIAAVINVSTTEGGIVVLSEDVLKSAALTFIVSIATLYGVFQPVGVDEKLKTSVGVKD